MTSFLKAHLLPHPARTAKINGTHKKIFVHEEGLMPLFFYIQISSIKKGFFMYIPLILLSITITTNIHTSELRRRKKTPSSSHLSTQQKISGLRERIKELEATPGKTAHHFADLQKHYAQMLAQETGPRKIRKWQQRHNLCIKRKNIMGEIEAIDRKPTPPTKGLNIAMQEYNWRALRDTYPLGSKHYAYYDEQTMHTAIRYKKIALEQTISCLLNQDSILPDDYTCLCEKVEALFGEQADQVLAELPGAVKIAASSIQATFSNSIQQSKKDPAPANLEPTDQNKEELSKLQRMASSYLIGKHFKPKVHASMLASLYNQIAAKSTGIEKQQAIETVGYLNRTLQQKKLETDAQELEQSLYSEEALLKLKNILLQLRDTYTLFDSNYEKITHKLSIIDRKRWYHIGDIEQLKCADSLDTDSARRHFTQTLICRLEYENDLINLYDNQPTLQELRNSYLKLLSTYDSAEPEHSIYINKVLEHDILIAIAQLNTQDMYDLTYLNKITHLKTLLLQIYNKQTPDHAALSQEIEMYKALTSYTEAMNEAMIKMDETVTRENIRYLHSLIVDLYAYATYINKTYTTTVKTDRIEAKINEYAQHIKYFETLDELHAIKNSPAPTLNTQKDLLREIIDSPYTGPYEKKEYLIQLINLTENITLKRRIIRDELLKLNIALNPNEQIYWNRQIAIHILSEKIRTLRDKLQTADVSEQISLNKELATCNAQRKALINNNNS
jgi:hypothetical protein